MNAEVEASSHAKPAKPTKTFQSYLLNKCLIGYGIINGIVNALIFYLMHMSDTAITFGYNDIMIEMATTGFLLGVILMECVLPLTRMDVRKDVFEVPAHIDGWQKRIPRSNLMGAIVIGLVAMVATLAVAAIFLVFLPRPLGFVPMLVFKGFLCAVAGAVAGYLSIYKTIVAQTA